MRVCVYTDGMQSQQLCAVCQGAALTGNRFRLRTEAARGSRPTELSQQLAELIPRRAGVDWDYEFLCRNCKQNIESAVKLKHRYELARKLILDKLSAISQLSDIFVGEQCTNESGGIVTPTRRSDFILPDSLEKELNSLHLQRLESHPYQRGL